jgi:hypothetical protein
MFLFQTPIKASIPYYISTISNPVYHAPTNHQLFTTKASTTHSPHDTTYIMCLGFFKTIYCFHSIPDPPKEVKGKENKKTSDHHSLKSKGGEEAKAPHVDRDQVWIWAEERQQDVHRREMERMQDMRELRQYVEDSLPQHPSANRTLSNLLSRISVPPEDECRCVGGGYYGGRLDLTQEMENYVRQMERERKHDMRELGRYIENDLPQHSSANATLSDLLSHASATLASEGHCGERGGGYYRGRDWTAEMEKDIRQKETERIQDVRELRRYIEDDLPQHPSANTILADLLSRVSSTLANGGDCKARTSGGECRSSGKGGGEWDSSRHGGGDSGE